MYMYKEKKIFSSYLALKLGAIVENSLKFSVIFFDFGEIEKTKEDVQISAKTKEDVQISAKTKEDVQISAKTKEDVQIR